MVNPARVCIYITANGVNVYVGPGKISTWDFVVSYVEEGAEPCRVYHRDFIRDIYIKRNTHSLCTRDLVDHLIEVINNTGGVGHFPPEIVQFDVTHVERFQEGGLGDAGGYDLELFLVMFELVQIQEETNHPNGWLPRTLYSTLRRNPRNLECVAYLTEIAIRSNERIREKVVARDILLSDLHGIVDG